MISEAYNVDCMDFMKDCKDKQFDLAIVDPPYGLDIANMNMGAGKAKRCCNINNRKWKPKDWDVAKPNNIFFKELFRISKNQIIWGGNYFIEYLYSSQGFAIWDKVIDESLSFSQCEFAWTSFAKSARIFKQSVYEQTDDKIHPTQKPVKLYKWLLKNYAKEGDTILDTHLGSGSSRIACYDYGFDFWGTELDKDYFEAQEKRFKNHIAQVRMFA